MSLGLLPSNVGSNDYGPWLILQLLFMALRRGPYVGVQFYDLTLCIHVTISPSLLPLKLGVVELSDEDESDVLG